MKKFALGFFGLLMLGSVISTIHAQDAQSKPQPQAQQEEAKPITEKVWRFGGGASFSSTANLKFDTVSITNSAGFFKADFDLKNTLSLEAEGRYIKPHAWGVIVGLTYDFERKFDGGTIEGNGRKITITGEDPFKLQTTILYANFAYQWDEFYVPFGFNYSFYKYTPSADFQGTSDVDGGLGLQFGLGYFANNQIAFEGIVRVLQIDLQESEDGMTVNYGSGTLASIQWTVKYIF